MAPEMLKLKKGDKHGYGYKVDIWALGVLFYKLLEKRSPFHGMT